MNIQRIYELIDSLKMIINSSNTINIPRFGSKDKIELKSNSYFFIVDLNRSGHKKPKCTYQLREQQNKEFPLLRLDLIGRTHKNPPGDYPFANEEIPCPHIHIAHPEYGIGIAYPLDSNYAKMVLTSNELDDLTIVLEKFLNRCNVGNTNKYTFQHQDSLF